jgi:hypothetical protein
MVDDIPRTIEKALAVNLDSLKYGTIVEIGAGQEVSRWFFQAGGAAGTIAKTMSAYDMNFSDEIYGATSDRRYVSRPRLERMLEYEFDLLLSRIEGSRADQSTFFAFANTVTAQGFKKQDECHGWLGIRLQSTPKAPPDDIVLHVRMLDDTNIEQQEALGVLGVNLIYGAYHYAAEPERLLRSLMDNLKWGRVEIDLVEFSGPTLGSIDNHLMALELVKASLTRAVLFDPTGRVVIPADALYKRRVLGMRGKFSPFSDRDDAMFKDARNRFVTPEAVSERPTVFLAEMTMADLANDKKIDTADFLARVNELTGRGFHVLISEFFRHFRVRQYLARYSHEPVAMVIDDEAFRDIMREDYYDGLDGGILEGLGQLFPPDTIAYVYSKTPGERVVTFEDMPIADHLRPLLTYLCERGRIVPVDEYRPEDSST